MAIGMKLFALSRQRLARYFELGKSFLEQQERVACSNELPKDGRGSNDVDPENGGVEIYIV